MRSFFSIVLATLVASTGLGALAGPTPVQRADCGGAEYCASNFSRRDVFPRMSPADGVQTNAKRLALGLSPMAPHRRENDAARRSSPSSAPAITKRGYIQVINSANGGVLGYISKNSFSGAQYRYQPELSDALIVKFSVDSAASSVTNARITSENSDTGFQILSLVQGRDDTNPNIGSGSFHYLYFASSAGTAPGSTPSQVDNSYSAATGTPRAVESDVWSINLSSGSVTAQWINTDSSKPTTQFWTQSTALYAGSDSAAFVARYPSPITTVTLKFVVI
ncbi:hypothetical protein BD779DRAFT_1466907 [Infundibulicybe gibba]|nr:hypothetical protein BD779DRAFT_1466907 [Infundibulicybe gibba]